MKDRNGFDLESLILFAFAVAIAAIAYHSGVRRGAVEGYAACRDSVLVAAERFGGRP